MRAQPMKIKLHGHPPSLFLEGTSVSAVGKYHFITLYNCINSLITIISKFVFANLPEFQPSSIPLWDAGSTGR